MGILRTPDWIVRTGFDVVGASLLGPFGGPLKFQNDATISLKLFF